MGLPLSTPRMLALVAGAVLMLGARAEAGFVVFSWDSEIGPAGQRAALWSGKEAASTSAPREEQPAPPPGHRPLDGERLGDFGPMPGGGFSNPVPVTSVHAAPCCLSETRMPVASLVLRLAVHAPRVHTRFFPSDVFRPPRLV